jgi:uncharacterized protein
MLELLALYSTYQWILIILAALCIGMGKGGLKGVDGLGVIIMAIAFGTKLSTGIVLPLLCMGDIAAVKFYNRHAQWRHFWKLVPWIVIGILAGVYFGKDMNEALFRKIMVFTVIITVVIVLWMEVKTSFHIPESKAFSASTGLVAGFTTMIGNMAGAFANLYFLAMRVPKNDFIGTTAWLFLCMNLFKLPFQLFVWKNIDWRSFTTDLLVAPVLALGFWIGIIIVRNIKEGHYRRLVLLLTLAGAIAMLLRK